MARLSPARIADNTPPFRIAAPMSLVPYALTRPFLFGLDPEHAHAITLDAIARLQNTPLQRLWADAVGKLQSGDRHRIVHPRRPGRRPRQERPLHRRPRR